MQGLRSNYPHVDSSDSWDYLCDCLLLLLLLTVALAATYCAPDFVLQNICKISSDSELESKTVSGSLGSPLGELWLWCQLAWLWLFRFSFQAEPSTKGKSE